MTNLDYYLTEDHVARQRTTIVCLIVGIILAILLQGFGLSLKDTAIACAVAACAVEIIRALSYTQPSVRAKRLMPVLSYRRTIMRSAFAVAIFTIAVLLRRIIYTPLAVEAALDSAEREAKIGNIEGANKQIQQVSDTLEQLKVKHIPAPPDFFRFAVEKINQLQPSRVSPESVHTALAGLAEYRASTNQRSNAVVHIGKMVRVGQFTLLKDSFISGQNAVNFGNSGGFVLDGFILDNVTFQDATVIYYGAGPVKLHHVRFVNCPFHIAATPDGYQLLKAIAGQSVVDAQIGSVPDY